MIAIPQQWSDTQLFIITVISPTSTLGSGYDTRGMRFYNRLNPNTKVFEVDLNKTQHHKLRLIANFVEVALKITNQTISLSHICSTPVRISRILRRCILI